MQPTPKGWPRFSSSVVYVDAAAAIEWLCNAFGFEVRLRIEGENGRIEHSELCFGEGVVMVSQENTASERVWKRAMRSPQSLGGCFSQSLMIYVDDAQAHCDRARRHGARIVEELAVHDYGDDYWADRSYGAVDLEGHLWWVTQRLRDPASS